MHNVRTVQTQIFKLVSLHLFSVNSHKEIVIVNVPKNRVSVGLKVGNEYH